MAELAEQQRTADRRGELQSKANTHPRLPQPLAYPVATELIRPPGAWLSQRHGDVGGQVPVAQFGGDVGREEVFNGFPVAVPVPDRQIRRDAAPYSGRRIGAQLRGHLLDLPGRLEQQPYFGEAPYLVSALAAPPAGDRAQAEERTDLPGTQPAREPEDESPNGGC